MKGRKRMDRNTENSNIETAEGINLKQKQAGSRTKKKKTNVTYTSTNEIDLKKAIENIIKIKAEKNYGKS